MGKVYDMSVWWEPKRLMCAICGRYMDHGVGVEGKTVDIDVCDDCAGAAITVLLGLTKKAKPSRKGRRGRKR
jgi:ribosome-binding protein aMBF1 (putative translation factor)